MQSFLDATIEYHFCKSDPDKLFQEINLFMEELIELGRYGV